ncbi:MAG: hypothetical protein KAJ01_03260, partial [Candidatus Hydrogenedentes bacterium]|nr:hypothetical protein [Candidatus Hydrogenedentota bacterium]
QQKRLLEKRWQVLERTRSLSIRNAVGCCYILGELESRENYNYLLKLVGELPIDSPVLGELGVALGKIGDRRAIEPLEKALEVCRKRAMAYFIAIASMSPPPPFSEEVSGKLIQGLGMLKAHSAVDTIVGIALTQYQGVRLSKVPSYAAQVLPTLVQRENRKKIEDMIVTILSDEAFNLTSQWHAAKSAGNMKIQPALVHLRYLLTDRRQSLTVMRAAGWAIQEITGQTPLIPQPRIRQGNWIIQKIIK